MAVKKPLKIVLLVAISLPLLAGAAFICLPRLEADIFDFSESRITPEIVQRFLRDYPATEGARFRHIHHVEAMKGGQTTIELELPAHRLSAFLAASPIKEADLQSDQVPTEILDSADWISEKRLEALDKSRSFQAGRASSGGSRHLLLIDQSRTETYTIYIQITS